MLKSNMVMLQSAVVFFMLLLASVPSWSASNLGSVQPDSILFVDAGVQDARQLFQGLAGNLRVVSLRDDADGVCQVADTMANGSAPLASFSFAFIFTNVSGYNYAGDKDPDADGSCANLAITAISFDHGTTVAYGSTLSGHSVTGDVSYQANPRMFTDGLLGYGDISMGTTRYMTVDNDFARASRIGTHTYLSVASSYEQRKDSLLLSPYARYDYASGRRNTLIGIEPVSMR